MEGITLTTEKTYNIEGIDPEGFISIRWHIDDVHEVYDGLTDEQAAEVLLLARDHHDAEVGICWDTLFNIAQALFHKNEEETVNG